MVKNKVLIGISAGVGLLLLAGCSPELPAINPSASPAKSGVAIQTVPAVSPLPGINQTMLQSSPPSSPDRETKTPSPDFSKIGELVTIGDQFRFTEGPTWDWVRKVLLFSDIDANRIYQLSLPNTITVFREPSNNSNGLAFDEEGNLLAAEHGSRSVTCIMKEGAIETLAGSFQGKQLNSPNDIAVRNDGTVYFTDPTYGLGNRKPGVDFMGIYRINKSGEVILAGKFDKSPNGLVFSPDQKTLYLALTTGNQVMAFEVSEDGSLQGGKVFATISQPDGMTTDRTGNLYVAGLEGVYIFSSLGSQLGLIKTKHQPTNCEFGGVNRSTLFITAREALYSIELSVTGY